MSATPGWTRAFTRSRSAISSPEEISVFFTHFAHALALPDGEAAAFEASLESALKSRVEIREMARNPVMLTALAVLQHNEQKLPEYRVDLYGSILGWLASAREQMPGRPPAEKCLEYLRKLALRMQDAAGDRVVQMNKRLAAELFDQEFGRGLEESEEQLERETRETGILVSAGADLKFWHLSFQEYLAAREIASLAEAEQIKRVVTSGKLYLGEWRETMRLLGALLRQQGEAKIEGFIRAILATVSPQSRLAETVCCVALLSAMMQDLSRMEYWPRTEGFERTVLQTVGIFECGESESIDISLRIEAAELLGQVGDPRLRENNWVRIPAGTFVMGEGGGHTRSN
jgi:hypothetical protein